MLLGVVQSFFLSTVIFLRSKNNPPILYFGWSLLFSSIVFFDTYLCYTGLIKNVIFLNDSSEAFVLLICPFIYFTLYGITKRKSVSFRKHWFHFVLPLFYFISQIPFYLGPNSVKYNAYIGAYYPHFEFANVSTNFNYGYHFIKDVFDWLILFSFLAYIVLSFKLVREERKRTKERNTGKYTFSRNAIVILMLLLVFVFIVFYTFDDDGGDHYIAIFQTIIAFSTTYLILSKSQFFKKSWIADKYETLSSSKSDLSFTEINDFVEKETYFLSNTASLHNLATLLNVHPNQISKAINQENKSNFNDFINEKRVSLSKIRLLDKAYAHLTIEAIGESVGFKSKSAFYNAFKKYTGSSPSSFVKSSSPKL